MNWIKVSDKLPPNSSKVLITDGRHIATAHCFGIIDQELCDKGFGDVGDVWWANQHERLTGWVGNPTHWMAMGDLLEETRKAICDCDGSSWCCGDPTEI